jgi:heptosyltransferase-1
VDWVIRPRWAPLLEGNPYVDEAIQFDRRRVHLGESLKRLRRDRYAVAVDFQGLIQSALVARAARAERVVGLDWARAREGLASLLYSTRVHTAAAHRVDSCLELAAAAGATSRVCEFPLPPGVPEGSLPEGQFVLACPHAGWEAKQWPRESYERLAEALQKDFGMPLVVNGAPESEAWLARIRGAKVHLSGLQVLIHATRRAHAVVGVDSGPLHLAAALAKPGVAIYGPTDPASHGPYGATIRVLRSPNAETSYKRRNAIDRSMRAITPEAVIEALGAVLAKASAGKQA